MAVKERNIVMCIILSIVTCGIYGFYWLVCLQDDSNALHLCTLYFYYYYISSTSDHQALDPRGWRPLIRENRDTAKSVQQGHSVYSSFELIIRRDNRIIIREFPFNQTTEHFVIRQDKTSILVTKFHLNIFRFFSKNIFQ